MSTSFGWEGKGRYGSFHSQMNAGCVVVKLWDPLRTRAIPECLRGVFATRCYTNPRLPYLTLPSDISFSASEMWTVVDMWLLLASIQTSCSKSRQLVPVASCLTAKTTFFVTRVMLLIFISYARSMYVARRWNVASDEIEIDRTLQRRDDERLMWNCSLSYLV